MATRKKGLGWRGTTTCASRACARILIKYASLAIRHETIVFSPRSEASEKDYSFHISRLQSAYAQDYSFEKKRLR